MKKRLLFDRVYVNCDGITITQGIERSASIYTGGAKTPLAFIDNTGARAKAAMHDIIF